MFYKDWTCPLCYPLNLPLMIVVSITFPMIFLTTNGVLLKSRGEFMFLNQIIEEPIFNYKLYGNRPWKAREFKNTVGNLHLRFIWTLLLNEISSPNTMFYIVKFYRSTSMFLATSMHRYDYDFYNLLKNLEITGKQCFFCMHKIKKSAGNLIFWDSWVIFIYPTVVSKIY